MRRLRAMFVAVLVVAATSAMAAAQEPIRFARTPDISPDGRWVAFSYLGDIWVVEAIGGVARHVTMHEKHDVGPVFSPDGRQLAFSSNRHGSYDVFVVPVQGGKPRRLTHDSANDYVTGWSPDGKRVLFSSARSMDFPPGYGLYTVAVEGGQAERVGVNEGREGAFSAKGDEIAYVRGPGTWYRKGYRGSSNDDVWICKADGTQHRQASTFLGQDNSPTWSPDGRFLYYVSETFGTPANIVRQDLTSKGPPEQLTHHKDDAVRRARVSASGEWMVYECGTDLWIASTRDGNARKLAIEVHADDKTNAERAATFTSGATEFALSHDEKHIAFVVHGEIFMMPRGGGKAKRLTDHPAYDHNVAWSPDSRKIIFLSDRGGQEDVYLLEQDDPEHPELTKAHRFKVKQLTNTPEEETGLNFSPDGRRISFLQGGKLFTMNADGTGLKCVVGETQVFDYEWSPDAKWLCYARLDGSFASELYIVPAEGATPADPPRNVTRYATFNAGVTWSQTGQKLAFISQRRRGRPTVCVLSLQKPAVAGSTLVAALTSREIDWEDVHRRVFLPAANISVSEAAISSDGTKVAFAAGDATTDLWVANTDGSQVTRLTSGGVKPSQIQWSRVAGSIVYFRDGGGNLRMLSVADTPAQPFPVGPPATNAAVPFQARMTVRQSEEFAEMFEQAWRALRENFYDPLFHGANWLAVRDKYRPVVKHCVMKEDLYTLISLMMGELNASHLGITGFLGGPEQTTADLGLVFNAGHRGPGLKIAEILKRGPADRRGLNLQAGDVILQIDNGDVSDKVDLATLLNDKAGEMVSLLVTSNPANPKDRRRLEIQAVQRQSVASLMYERWVDKNARRVADLSKGKLGYIHIPSMDDAGLDHFLRALYSDNYDKDAIILDVRYNGGGYTHDQILNYLGGKEHTFFRQRYGGQGLVLNFNDRKWTKPLVVLINNQSFSDAEIFPHAFRTLGLGKLVGQPTGGHVIGTRTVKLIDGSSFRIPRIGVTTVQGVNMEKEGVAPDFAVDLLPDHIVRGQDPQIDKAVDVLQQAVAEWKKGRGPVAQSPPNRPAPIILPMPSLPGPVALPLTLPSKN